MICGWQQLMHCFDPIALSVGSFQITWYAICFLLAWQVALRVLLLLEREQDRTFLSSTEWQSLFWWLLLGGVLGARLGFVLFYEPYFFAQHLSQIFMPYDFGERAWVQIRGMSFHGGVLGVAVTLLWWARTRNMGIWSITDRLAVVAPLLAVFGRLGNFLNQELPGRVTEYAWGMYFPGEVLLRHPSTLYALLGEGILLFLWMLFWKKRLKRDGALTFLYLCSYASIRFLLEMWRQPDPGVSLLFDVITRGQLLSVGMIFVALATLVWLKKYGTIRGS